MSDSPDVWFAATLPGFAPQQQEASRWCAAAIASTIAFYYTPGTHWAQCNIITVLLGRQCCVTPVTPACNQGVSLAGAMQRVGAWQAQVLGKPQYQLPVEQVNLLRPLAIVIQWFAGGAHALSIYGYRYEPAQNIYQLLIADPWHNAVWYVDYALFPQQYEGGATWTETDLS